jgi:catechol 2,3-dioxygenase-like lactoylglutathione lyase family enzyme
MNGRPGRGRRTALVNHIGMTTPDILATIRWYESVLGFRLIMGPRVLEAAGASPETRQIYGEGFRRAYQAHMLAGNGVGIEVFQFLEPAVDEPEPTMHYTRRGFSHLCLTVEDVPADVAAVVAAGGSQISDPAYFVPGRPWQLAYCRDPWGVTLELMSASYAEAFANWPQPGMEQATRMLAPDGSEYTMPPPAAG